MTSLEAYENIKALLEENEFRELPGLLNADEVKESHTNEGFILQPTGTDEDEYTSGGLFTNYKWRLEIIFKNIDAKDRVEKFDRFNEIKRLLHKLSSEVVIDATAFNRLGNFTFLSLGTINFNYGAQDCDE